jgi:hypothetical protein
MIRPATQMFADPPAAGFSKSIKESAISGDTAVYTAV